MRTPPNPHREGGAAAVELAIVAPLLFMLIFGIIQFGIAWSQKQVFVQAAREGARYAAVACENTCTLAEIQDRVESASVGYQITGTKTSVAASPVGCSASNTSDTVRVSWDQQFQISLPFVPAIDLTAPIEAVFRCER